ncbi:hypothetical protein IscW_ISCW008239 [Ixodes scapularis]|uniref:Uncharacterized protein n=1 Tax=Ixodes scapularis TaxID=6945 RepID=B7PS28_IXOSC|nr:hypothetical protein IscW_ISCW008239 [Ixodes scapularis]|eukprot:XP_002401782.1 hypothetical protein IscW_ISCW008239 [Ixodes scapularis]
MKTWEARNTPSLTYTLLLPPKVVLVSLDLETLHGSCHWISNGTLEYCRPTYTAQAKAGQIVRNCCVTIQVGLMSSLAEQEPHLNAAISHNLLRLDLTH